LAAALAVVPFLPLYVERTFLRSWGPKMAGDAIEWGWRIRTLAGFWADYNYFRPEQRPAVWLCVNIALAFIYALLVALVVERFLARRIHDSVFRRGRL
jgi:hypothetical protein